MKTLYTIFQTRISDNQAYKQTAFTSLKDARKYAKRYSKNDPDYFWVIEGGECYFTYYKGVTIWF